MNFKGIAALCGFVWHTNLHRSLIANHLKGELHQFFTLKLVCRCWRVQLLMWKTCIKPLNPLNCLNWCHLTSRDGRWVERSFNSGTKVCKRPPCLLCCTIWSCVTRRINGFITGLLPLSGVTGRSRQLQTESRQTRRTGVKTFQKVQTQNGRFKVGGRSLPHGDDAIRHFVLWVCGLPTPSMLAVCPAVGSVHSFPFFPFLYLESALREKRRMEGWWRKKREVGTGALPLSFSLSLIFLRSFHSHSQSGAQQSTPDAATVW